MFSPFSLAFPGLYSDKLFAFDLFMNFSFMTDVLVNFCTAYVDEYYQVIDDRKVRKYSLKI